MNSGLAYPFVRDGGGIWGTETGDELKEDQMDQCIRTIVGSRPVLKYVGSEVARILFINDIESRNAVLTKFIKDAIEEFVEKVIIDKVTATKEGEEGKKFIFDIQYRLENEVKSFKMPYMA